MDNESESESSKFQEPRDDSPETDNSKTEKQDDQAKNKVPPQPTPTEKPINYEDIGASEPEKEFLQPKKEDSDEVKILKYLLAESMLQRKQAMQDAGKIRDVLTSYNTAMSQLIEMFTGTDDPDVAKAVGDRIDKMENTLNQESIKYEAALQTMNNLYKEQNKLFLQNRQLSRLYMSQIEDSQLISEDLKKPTLERMAARLSENDRKDYENEAKIRTETIDGEAVEVHYVRGKRWVASNPLYQAMVKKWLQDQISNMERNDLAFEEQPDRYRYISLHVNNFALTKGTRKFGEELVDILETRRTEHLTKRVGSFSPPDGVAATLAKINTPTFSKYFKKEIKASAAYDEKGKEVFDEETGELETVNRIEDELRNYERMMRILRERRIEYKRAYRIREEEVKKQKKKKRLSIVEQDAIRKEAQLKEKENEIKAKELYINDYYMYGGHIEDINSLDNAYVGGDRWNEADIADITKGEKSNDNEDGFFYKLGKQNNPQNGYEEKDLIKNLIVEGDDFEQMYRDITWARFNAGGLSSLMFRVSREAQLNGTIDFYAQRILNLGEKLSSNYLMRNSREYFDATQGSYKDETFSPGYVDLLTSMLNDVGMSELIKAKVGITKKVLDHNGSFLSFENLEFGNNKLWNLVNKKTKKGQPAIRGARFKEVDDFRSFHWGPDSYAQSLTLEASPRIEGLGTFLGTGPYKDENGELGYEIRGTRRKVYVSEMEAKQIELMDRSIEYLKTDVAADKLGNPLTGYAQTAEIRKWIRSWQKNLIIETETAQILLDKHLGTHNKFVLDRMVEVSILWNDFKTNVGGMSWQAFMELLKRAFGYVFTDELRA